MRDVFNARLKRFRPQGEHRAADEHLVAFSKTNAVSAKRIPADGRDGLQMSRDCAAELQRAGGELHDRLPSCPLHTPFLFVFFKITRVSANVMVAFKRTWKLPNAWDV